MLRHAYSEPYPDLLAVLHTWDGWLGYQPLVHLLITEGGITPDSQHWDPAGLNFSCCLHSPAA